MRATGSPFLVDKATNSKKNPAPIHQAAPTPIKQRVYPETAAGGFSRVDGVVEFFTRINALVTPESRVLEFGSGRGLGSEDPVRYRRELRTLRGRVREVVGVDIDPIVLENPMLDSAAVLEADAPMPFADSSFDLILSENTFEHLDDPQPVAEELTRVLKPGGWICARTPNRWGYVGIATNLVPNKYHTNILRRVQPNRQTHDVFPTFYKLNSRSQIERHFSKKLFESYTYTWNAEPAYFGSSLIGWRMAQLAFRLMPETLGATLFIFLQKHA